MDMERQVLKATELRLGLPGSDVVEPQKQWTSNNKRSSSQMDNDHCEKGHQDSYAPPTKQQVVGWPPVRSYRKNTLQQMKKEDEGCGACMYVKVSMDGAPFLRKMDVKVYNNYSELLKALDNMFKCNIGISEFAVTYEDKDGDWMLAGDVPWDMFVTSCKRLRIMKASGAKGLGCL